MLPDGSSHINRSTKHIFKIIKHYLYIILIIKIDTIRVRRRSKMSEKLAGVVGLSAESEYSRVIARVQQEIGTRFRRLGDINFKS